MKNSKLLKMVIEKTGSGELQWRTDWNGKHLAEVENFHLSLTYKSGGVSMCAYDSPEPEDLYLVVKSDGQRVILRDRFFSTTISKLHNIVEEQIRKMAAMPGYDSYGRKMSQLEQEVVKFLHWNAQQPNTLYDAIVDFPLTGKQKHAAFALLLEFGEAQYIYKAISCDGHRSLGPPSWLNEEKICQAFDKLLEIGDLECIDYAMRSTSLLTGYLTEEQKQKARLILDRR